MIAIKILAEDYHHLKTHVKIVLATFVQHFTWFFDILMFNSDSYGWVSGFE